MSERELLEAIISRMDSIEANMATKQELATGMDNLTVQMGNLTELVATQTKNMDTLAALVGRLSEDVSEVKTRAIQMENEHGQQLGALLDGYKQNAEKLDRIDKTVAKHEETLLTKVK